MDVMGLAGTAVGLLAQLLAGGHSGEPGVLGDLFTWVKSKLGADSGPSAAAVAAFENTPEDARTQGSLTFAIAHLISQNPAWADELSGLVDAAKTGDTRVRDAGAVAIGGDVRISGTYAAGRDMTIGVDHRRADEK